MLYLRFFFLFFIKGKQAKEAIWPENVEIVSSPCFIWLFYWYLNTTRAVLLWIWLPYWHSYIGSFCISKEQEKVGLWHVWYCCHMCQPYWWQDRFWAQNRTTHGHIFLNFQKFILANRMKNWKKNCIFYFIYTLFLMIGPVMLFSSLPLWEKFNYLSVGGTFFI